MRLASAFIFILLAILPLGSSVQAQDTTPPIITPYFYTIKATHFEPACAPIFYDFDVQDDMGVVEVRWMTDHGDAGIIFPPNAFIVSIPSLFPGATRLTVTAYDAAGNVGTLTRTLHYSQPDLLPADWVTPSGIAGTPLADPGDVNGDGFDDLLFGNRSTGTATLVFGSTAGPAGTQPWSFPPRGNIAAAGDVNRDGFDDIIVGVPPPASPAPPQGIGRAHLYLGGSSGLSASPSWTIEELSAGEVGFGRQVASAGDVNADGYDDVLISTGVVDNHIFPHEGRIDLYRGSFTGLASTPSWSYILPIFGSPLPAAFPAGDVNRDDFDDIVQPVYGGDVLVFHGSHEGPPAFPSTVIDSGSEPDYSLDAEGAGDVNGDGFDDLLVSCGACFVTSAWSGAARVYYGSPGGILASNPSEILGAFSEAFFSWGSRRAGDVDADGYDDLLIAERSTFCDSQPRTHLYRGSAEGLAPHATASWTNPGGLAMPMGDVNGDGGADFALGRNLFLGAAADGDGDGPGPDADCNDADPSVWTAPGEVAGLEYLEDKTTLGWNAPVSPGAEPGQVSFDVLRAAESTGLSIAGEATCLESGDGLDRIALAAEDPPPGGLFVFAVRARNACGAGPLTSDGAGLSIAGPACP